jgi:NADH-ubiquinone oxidoreductase chain 5
MYSNIQLDATILSWFYFKNIILMLVSGLTMFMAVLGANFEYDLKRIIDLSTQDKLGLMIITISVGLSSLAFLNLLAPEFFLIFLAHPVCKM